jgi:hypothetical protein
MRTTPASGFGWFGTNRQNLQNYRIFWARSGVGPEALTEAQRHGGGGKAWFGAACIWEGPSSSHGPFFSREAASLLEMQWRHCRANGSAAARRPYLGKRARYSARRGLVIVEVAARVSFTVETTVLLSFALPRGDCSGVSIERRECASSSHGPFLRRSRLCIQQTAAAPPGSWVMRDDDPPRV